MSSFEEAISIIRTKSKNEVELGTAFEKLAKVFLENDNTQKQQYTKIWHYKDWVKDNPGYSKKDIGIDLVAELSEEEGFCAIQCKCYLPEHQISKEDIDSFIAASSTSHFKRLMLIDTSIKSLGKNADKVFQNLDKDYIRIQKIELELSNINWLTFINEGNISFKPKKELMDHQIQAIGEVKKGFKKNDRGKMIMACGTGKTFTSLNIAEDLFGRGKLILYMVPSLSLMSQTIREWKNDSKNDFNAFAVCSDIKVEKKTQSDDFIDIDLSNLAFPATTNAKKLSQKIKNSNNSQRMTVIFSTYHSIDVIKKSQFNYDLDEFDLIICDEAHRTTGATLIGDDESHFIKIHNNENVKGKKRLYMTATPRVYGDVAKKKQLEGDVVLASMDDENTFGKTFFKRGFGWAVENNLLADYKVIVLTMDEGEISKNIQRQFTDGSELKLDDATKIIGCYKALAKIGIENESLLIDKEPMKRALAFCQKIKFSQIFSSEFSKIINEYLSNQNITNDLVNELKVEVEHVDGTFNAEERNEKLGWLKGEIEKNTCKVLSNARCLSEGVDVPSLDAIMFVHPRKSQIDIIQSVGRVMRKSENKKLGYVIIPVTIAPGITADKALDDNERFKVVWQILNALRAHDERFDSTINKIGLGEDVSERVEIINGTSKLESDATTVVIDDVKNKPKNNIDDKNTLNISNEDKTTAKEKKDFEQLKFTFDDLSNGIKAKIVEKCGTREYWEKWAIDIARIAQKHILDISSVVLNTNTKERSAFVKFLQEIRDDINPEVSEKEAVEMLAQHIITQPVFDVLFEENKFTKKNGVSIAMETVISKLYNNDMKKNNETLETFYLSVERRAKGIVTSNAKQKLILELYERFFKYAFPEISKKLGIVYTPVPVVDFIINSTEEIMKNEFNQSLGDSNINILDPFSGTGTFTSRLLQSGILSSKQIKHKFNNEIYANEIILLAYYISCINIESTYNEIFKNEDYLPFKGMVLTDTFQLYEKDDKIAELLPDNSERRKKQRNSSINVVIGNPPYSVHSRVQYPKLDKKYKAEIIDPSKAKHKSGLNDPYYKAIFWATSHIKNNGVISFIVNNSWIEASISDAFRKFLEQNFSSIYLIDLKGNVRKARFDRDNTLEGENIFGNKSQNGIAIIFLVKKSKYKGNAQITYMNIGDNLKTNEKLNKLSSLNSLKKLKSVSEQIDVKPNSFGDWLNPRIKVPKSVYRLGDKTGSNPSIFLNYTSGIKTNRDEWAINFSKKVLEENMKKLISTYKNVLDSPINLRKSKLDTKNIKWDGTLETCLKNKKFSPFSIDQIRRTSLRPFIKSYVYFSEIYNNSIYQNNFFFPINHNNFAIGVPFIGSRSNFRPLGVNEVPNYDFFDKTQFFPRYTYTSKNNLPLFDGNFTINHHLIKKSNINPDALKKFQLECKDDTLLEDDLFYYCYSLLNSSKYLNHYHSILDREMPPIPFTKFETKKKLKDFCLLGKKLFELHINWEDQETFEDEELFAKDLNFPKSLDITKIIKKKEQGQNIKLIANNHVILSQIPSYILKLKFNGRSPLEWVMQRTKTRRYSTSENIDNLKHYYDEINQNFHEGYLNYLKKIINVSIKTQKILLEINDFKLTFNDDI